MHEDAPDQPVDGYRVERLIGAGGMGAVYEVRQLGPDGPGERLACKVIHEQYRAEPMHRELMRKEAVLSLGLTAGHPNLVRALDYFDDARDQRCIVMELVDGASVAELRGPDRRLPFPVARRIACEVLEALAYLHGQDVLHRDLSPRNILVSTAGAVKVADLGIAKVMRQGQVHTRTFRGVTFYASPEALQCASLDERSDLFTLSAILFELVSGTPPCGELAMEGMVVAHMLQGRYQPLPPDTPADLAELITGLLRVEREARQPRTAAEALALLRRHAQPMASPEELGALVVAAQARRDQALADARPENALAPGHVLAPRMDAPNLAPGAPGQAAAGMIRMRLRHTSSVRRGVARRAAGILVLIACIVALALVLLDRFRGEHGESARQPAPELPVAEPAPEPELSVAEPAPPVAPIAPVPVTPERAVAPEQDATGEPAGSRRATERADARDQRGEGRSAARVRAPGPARRRPVPHASEPPPWGRR